MWPVKATGTSIRQIMKASSRGQLEQFSSKKEKDMTNANTEITTLPTDLGMVEILDAEGNPTGQYLTAPGDGETAPAEATFVEDSADHTIN